MNLLGQPSPICPLLAPFGIDSLFPSEIVSFVFYITPSINLVFTV